MFTLHNNNCTRGGAAEAGLGRAGHWTRVKFNSLVITAGGQGAAVWLKAGGEISLTRAKSKSLLLYIMSRNGRIPFGTNAIDNNMDIYL